ncbi:MAG: hypothetical protein ACPG4T_24290, partial [Nannocystaceae bacterium]
MGKDKRRIWLEVPHLALDWSMSPWVNEAGLQVRIKALQLVEQTEFQYPADSWIVNPTVRASTLVKTRIKHPSTAKGQAEIQKYARMLTGYQAPIELGDFHKHRLSSPSRYWDDRDLRSKRGTAAREVEGTANLDPRDEFNAETYNRLFALYLTELSIFQDVMPKDQWPASLSPSETASLLMDNWHRGDRGFTNWIVRQVEESDQPNDQSSKRVRTWLECDDSRNAEIRTSLAGFHTRKFNKKLLVQTNILGPGQVLD